jgi:hypothetical protein
MKLTETDRLFTQLSDNEAETINGGFSIEEAIAYSKRYQANLAFNIDKWYAEGGNDNVIYQLLGLAYQV